MGMPNWIEGQVVTNGTKLHYYRGGTSKPALVMLHGITDDGPCWTPVAGVLARGYDIVMVDQRGHGKSDAPQAGYDAVTMAADVAGLVAGLGLERPFVIGHSMGAVTAMALAGLQPRLPRAIVLEDPPLLWQAGPPSQPDAGDAERKKLWFQVPKRKTRDELLEAVRAEHPDWQEAELGPWVDAKHRFSPRVAQFLDSEAAVAGKLRALVGQIACPTLLITADPERGAIVAQEDVAALRELVPHLEEAHIPGAGHSIRREQFEPYLNAVQAFLAAQ
jgi:pimeloyl-ACP methyl ester carboxylesterase